MMKLRSVRWLASRSTELVIALVVVYIGIGLTEYRQAMKREAVPASDWFEITEIFVPDHAVGSNPDMIYGRTIHVAHRGFWVAEVQRVNPGGHEGVFQNACTGSGVNEYEEDEVLIEQTVTWSWFFGRPCRVGPGVYRVKLTRDMAIPGWPVKKTDDWSNTFRVSASSVSLSDPP